ncbi:LysR family transcriptional regulator [Exiguobacterium artemiae]|uniref:LysR family transcriptional regulator n=1 Tax=Exiguobacterium artemiae TaxID=340145 RepID=UPI002964657B|nr:LysR family transcriptional regulator [Exiguobacterium sibiricum]MDW2884670.1 LysR family transcriptional regulator [Exiguobacterium sibiricum]
MKLHELKTFVTLVETKHFTRTAEQLFISQPTVSVHLKRLEEEVEQPLLLRHVFNTSIEVSDAGWVVYHHAKEMLFQAEQMQLELDELKGFVRGTLRLASTHTIYETMLEEMIHDFLIAYPDVSIDARIMNHDQVEQALLHHEIDIGLVEGDPLIQNINCIPFAKDQLYVIGRTGLNMSKATWIFREEGSAARTALIRWLDEQKIEPHKTITVHSNHLIRQLIMNGTGISTLSERFIQPLKKLKEYQVYAEDIENRTFQFAIPKEQPSRLALKWIEETIKNK